MVVMGIVWHKHSSLICPAFSDDEKSFIKLTLCYFVVPSTAVSLTAVSSTAVSQISKELYQSFPGMGIKPLSIMAQARE
jgi:hypothetical protein